MTPLDPKDPKAVSRRDVIKTAAATSAGLALSQLGIADAHAEPAMAPPRLAATMAGVPFEKRDTLRIAIVGTGLRGRSMLGEWLGVENVKITALCDVVPEKIELAKAAMKKAGHTYEPAVFTGGDHDFEKLVQRDDIDFVYTATPWPFHVPVMLAALGAGKHCGTEVPAATTIEDCWKLVDASEKSRRHCMIMENCNYGENEMLVLTMARAGLFGELLSGGAAYNHDLRSILFENRDEGLWRRIPHTQRNGNFYPTHGLGPVSAYMDINRGDRFDYMVSMSTPEYGLTAWREKNEPKDSPKWKEKYIEGDVSKSLIRTVKGRVILLEHDVVNPRPYSRINSLQGTKGIFEDYPARVYIEGDGREAWNTGPAFDKYKTDHTHRMWKDWGERAKTGGHGGMDFIQAMRIAECFHKGLPPDIDVYDAVSWSAPGPMSEKAVASRGAPQVFPDFTRGAWEQKRASF